MHTFRSRLAALALSAVTLTGALGLPAAALSTPAPWAEPEVTAAAQLQLVPYELLDEYDAPTTRAEFCKLVVKLLCEYTNRNEDSLADYLFPNGYDKTPFPDTSDKYVALCAAAGIVGGREEGGFDPEASIQRQEAAKMLSLCASVMNTPEEVEGSSFSDAALIADWARPFVDYVSGVGMMNGRDENNFDPRGNYSRQESILTFYRLFLMEKSDIRQPLRESAYPYLNFGADAYEICTLANGGAAAILTDALQNGVSENGGAQLFPLSPTQMAALRLTGNAYDVENLSVEQKKAVQKRALDFITGGVFQVGLAVPADVQGTLYLRVTQSGQDLCNWVPLARQSGAESAFGGSAVYTAELFDDLFYLRGAGVDYSQPIEIILFNDSYSYAATFSCVFAG